MIFSCTTFIFSAGILLFIPESAFAWGPATHLHFGLSLLEQPHLLSESVRLLLLSHSQSYLYGCISADIVLIKKLGSALEHCHRWEKGGELLEAAENGRQKAFAMGYLSHLAADCISHNCFVPSKTIESADSGMLKHVYWELCFDRRVTDARIHALFRSFLDEDFSDCDALFEKVISMRVLNFSFNKRMFDRVIKLQGLGRWQKLLSSISEQSDYPLTQSVIEDYSQRSIQAMSSFLNDPMQSWVRSFDPQGSEREAMVTRLRKDLSKLGPARRREAAFDWARQLNKLPQ